MSYFLMVVVRQHGQSFFCFLFFSMRFSAIRKIRSKGSASRSFGYSMANLALVRTGCALLRQRLLDIVTRMLADLSLLSVRALQGSRDV